MSFTVLPGKIPPVLFHIKIVFFWNPVFKMDFFSAHIAFHKPIPPVAAVGGRIIYEYYNEKSGKKIVVINVCFTKSGNL